jgi:hypothetical protein
MNGRLKIHHCQFVASTETRGAAADAAAAPQGCTVAACSWTGHRPDCCRYGQPSAGQESNRFHLRSLISMMKPGS